MRQAIRQNRSKAPKSYTAQEAAPVKGWMSQENYAEAEPMSAVIMQNMFPEADAVRARRGHIQHAVGLAGTVQTLLCYVTTDANSRMFAATSSTIWNVTSSSSAPVSMVTGRANGRWQQTMFATPGGQFLVACNGADGVWTFDTAGGWVNRSASIVAPTTPSGPAPTPTAFIGVHSHKRRLWFVESGTMDLWYLETEAIAGPCYKFPVGALFSRGGYVMAIGTYSVDSGSGMDDVFCVITSDGQVALYAGTDPGSANTWQLVGVYTIGHPIGRRCLYDVGGDLLIITEDGVLPISRATHIDRAVAGAKSVTANIRQAYVDAVQRARDLTGWEICAFSLRNMAILNVPATGGVPIQQFAFNTITGGWGQFVGMNAHCWAEFNDALYFGGVDKVFRAEYGATDNGVPIAIKVLPAFSHLNSRGRLKHVKDMRFYLSTDIIAPGYNTAVAVDYQEPTGVSGAQTSPGTGWFQWNVTPWDGPSVWYGGEQVAMQWTGAANIGTVISPYMVLNLDASTAGAEFKFRWIATDFIYEHGGVL